VKLVPMKSFRSIPGLVYSLPAPVHVVGQIEDLAITIVRTDKVGIVDPAGRRLTCRTASRSESSRPRRLPE